jgi:hypothetical protein
MANQWIKIRTNLIQDPDVMRLSDMLGTDDPTTVGLLVIFWSWADGQTPDGAGIAITAARLDRLVGRAGFTDGLREIGWLTGEDGDLRLCKFDRHNGHSAKARALEAEAKRLRRAADEEGAASTAETPATPPSPAPAPPPAVVVRGCRTFSGADVGPEKRREEKMDEGRAAAMAAAAPGTAHPPGGAGDTLLPRLTGLVNSLRPAWRGAPAFTSGERRWLAANREALASIRAEDWAVMRAYLSARLPEGSPAWQPRSRSKFLEHPTDVLAHALDWQRKQHRPPPPKPAPPGPAEQPFSKAELATMLDIGRRRAD